PAELAGRHDHGGGGAVRAARRLARRGRAGRRAVGAAAGGGGSGPRSVGRWTPLLAGRDLAEMLMASPRAWSGRLRASDGLARFRPELAILLPNSLESALAASLARARRRLGAPRGGGS